MILAYNLSKRCKLSKKLLRLSPLLSFFNSSCHARPSARSSLSFRLSRQGFHMLCQSLEIWELVTQENQPKEPENHGEPEEPRRTRGTRRRVSVTKSIRRDVTSAVAITREISQICCHGRTQQGNDTVNNTASFSIMHLNAGSLFGNLDKVNLLLSNVHKPSSVIALLEICHFLVLSSLAKPLTVYPEIKYLISSEQKV